MDKTIRLDKFISDNTDFSRSEIKKLVRSGKVEVDGAVVRKPEEKILPTVCKVNVLGKNVIYRKKIYIIINKPDGVLSATDDKSRKTVVDLLPDEFKRYDLFPVGRLDKDTTGLLILTNDGEFAHKVISPKSHIEKEYIAQVDGEIPPDIDKRFADGIVLADGTECMPAQAEKIDENTVKVIIKQGKYHQVKRMLGVLGLGVNKLHRVRIGALCLPNDLKCSDFVEINEIISEKALYRT